MSAIVTAYERQRAARSSESGKDVEMGLKSGIGLALGAGVGI